MCFKTLPMQSVECYLYVCFQGEAMGLKEHPFQKSYGIMKKNCRKF